VTAVQSRESFGPYEFALAPAEADAAAARLGLRVALGAGLIARHLAPLAAFALIILFASVLSLTGFVSRRAGEATLLVAAAAFMLQRLIGHWRMQRARAAGHVSIAPFRSCPLTATIDDEGVTMSGASQQLRVDYADCADIEDAGGLLYLWPRSGAPIVLPTRALPDGESARLIEGLKDRVRRAKPASRSG
jgi:hypothetical protein